MSTQVTPPNPAMVAEVQQKTARGYKFAIVGNAVEGTHGSGAVLHIRCRDEEEAQALLDAATAAL